MNIWDQVKQFPNADYFDMHTGYTYHIQEYTRTKNLGLPTSGIRVSCDGKLVGFVREESKG